MADRKQITNTKPIANSKQKTKRKMITVAALCMLMGSASGCNTSTTKISEGMASVEALDYQTALVNFDEADKAKENARLIARGRGIAYMGQTKYDEAIQCFLEALSLSDGILADVDFDLNYYLAAAYTKKEQYAEAEECYDAILGLRSGEEDAYYLRGNVRLQQGKYPEAEDEFERVIRMDPKNYDRIVEIFNCLQACGQEEVGKSYLRQTMENNSKSMTSFDKGKFYYYLGEYQNACIALEDAKEKGKAEGYLFLGKAYEATGDYNYASSVYNGYLSKNEPNAAIYNQLGLCELKKGDCQKALESFQAGLAVNDPATTQNLLFNQIVAYEYLSDFAKAKELIEEYVKLYPDDEAAIREQVFLSSR